LYKECGKRIDLISKLRPILDLSNYPETSAYYNTKNAGKLGFFRDEMAGKNTITHFAGLRSKTYALKTKDKEIAKCKGIPKCAKRKLTFAKFKKCLEEITEEQVVYFNMRSINHEIYTQNIRKRALCTFDE
jgi:hypothetical protein